MARVVQTHLICTRGVSITDTETLQYPVCVASHRFESMASSTSACSESIFSHQCHVIRAHLSPRTRCQLLSPRGQSNRLRRGLSLFERLCAGQFLVIFTSSIGLDTWRRLRRRQRAPGSFSYHQCQRQQFHWSDNTISGLNALPGPFVGDI